MIALLLQRRSHHFPHRLVIVNEQKQFSMAASERRLGEGRGPAGRLRFGAWQINLKTCAGPDFALYSYKAAMVSHDSHNGRETQASAFAGRFRGKERFE